MFGRRFPRAVKRFAATTMAGAFVLATGVSGIAVAGPAAADDGSSAVTVTAKQQDPKYASAPFPDLSVTVSQTQDLQQQAVTVSWSGAALSAVPSGDGGRNFLQIFQCWGDDPDDSSRPDRTTCQYGGTSGAGASRESGRPSAASIAGEDEQYSVKPPVFFLPWTTSIPFRAVDGTTVTRLKKVGTETTLDETVNVDQNQFFSQVTTNEVAWAPSDATGHGSLSFEIQTGAQAPGLGCGQPVQVGSQTQGRSCWLVILPRGTADNGSPVINQSGLFWDSWQHALAVKMSFRPIGNVCPAGASEKILQGSELLAIAVRSWQPSVCQQAGGSVYSLLTGTESDALLAAATTEGAPLALTTRAFEPIEGQKDPLHYAPVGLTGIAISFVIDQNPDPTNSSMPQSVKDAATQPIQSLKLTPRLLAKLLTSSYLGAMPPGADRSHLGNTSTERGHNPTNITQDPEFLAANADNPVWKYQALNGVGLVDLLVPQGRSDAAWTVWRYIVADPDARAWLDGKPDDWGMIVNPWYSSNATINPTHTGMVYPRDDFPKADPVEWQGPTREQNINLVTWRPYVNDLDQAAYLTLRGDAQELGGFSTTSIPPRYGKAGRATPGFQKVLSLSDSSAASRYQVVTASLRNPAGEYVAPTTAAMSAAASAMSPAGAGGQVVGFDPSSAAAQAATAAYPLAVPVYAAARRGMTDAGLRAAYSAFIRYAADAGQTPGAAAGQLPAGYAPIPDAWRQQAEATADTIGADPAAAVAPPASGGGSAPAIPASTNRSAAAVPPPAAAAAPAASNPVATGAPQTSLSGATTPEDPVSVAAAAVPISVAASAAALLALPVLSRRRRL